MPKLPNAKRYKGFAASELVAHREIGLKRGIGFADKFSLQFSQTIHPHGYWDQTDHGNGTEYGGIFNLEFSPDGSLLVAACEKRSILMFDPLNRKKLCSIDNAHSDCVNCVKFLDNRMFATCSDDSTVALWDSRNLKYRIRNLSGHSNWVKNIEFSSKDNLLVTSGFDGSIYTWDINSYTENSFVYQRVFRTSGLMRTRLTPDSSKMIICTTGGYMIIIHDLDLHSLQQDLLGFKPNMYRLMQLSKTVIPVAASFTHLFDQSRKRNRVEFVVDFPHGNEAEVVSSLQVHPHGWCILSRNISNDEDTEWSCVHDIQSVEDKNFQADNESDEEDDSDMVEELTEEQALEAEEHGYRTVQMAATAVAQQLREHQVGAEHEGYRTLQQAAAEAAYQLQRLRDANNARTTDENNTSDAQSTNPQRATANSNSRSTLAQASTSSTSDGASTSSAGYSGSDDEAGPSSGRPELTREQREAITAAVEAQRRAGGSSSGAGISDWQGQVNRTIRNVGQAVRNQMLQQNQPGINPEQRMFFHMSSYNLAARTVLLLSESRNNGGVTYTIPPNHKIHKNRPHLTHYIQEPNVGRGFIKELCFSPDGRLICSPFGYGIRLLSFDSECSELSHCVPSVPTVLHEQNSIMCHKCIVVSSKFSPCHGLLVSGCLGGKIAWYQPKL